MQNEVPTLESICYKSIAESITRAPPFLQEQIYDLTKESYKKQIRDEVKEEIKADVRLEVMEELLEQYLDQIPILAEEASSLLVEHSYTEKDVTEILCTSVNVEREIVEVATACASSSYEKLKNTINFNRHSDNMYDFYDIGFEY